MQLNSYEYGPSACSQSPQAAAPISLMPSVLCGATSVVAVDGIVPSGIHDAAFAGLNGTLNSANTDFNRSCSCRVIVSGHMINISSMYAR